MTYQVGDRVKIVDEGVIRSFRRWDRDIGGVAGWQSKEGLYIDTQMLEYCNSIVTIKKVLQNRPGGNTWYHVEENNWFWSNSCLESAYSFDGLEDLL